MFPDPHDSPSGLAQSFIGVRIAVRIRTKLLQPPLAIRRRFSSVFRAGMPEAPVDKHRHPPTRKRYVDASAWPSRDRKLHPESEPGPMKSFSQCQFGSRGTVTDTRHPRGDSRRRRRGTPRRSGLLDTTAQPTDSSASTLRPFSAITVQASDKRTGPRCIRVRSEPSTGTAPQRLSPPARTPRSRRRPTRAAARPHTPGAQGTPRPPRPGRPRRA